MRGRRLSEVAVRARRSAHRPSYMDVEYTVCMYRQTLDVHVRGWQQQAYTQSSHITVLNLACSPVSYLRFAGKGI